MNSQAYRSFLHSPCPLYSPLVVINPRYVIVSKMSTINFHCMRSSGIPDQLLNITLDSDFNHLADLFFRIEKDIHYISSQLYYDHPFYTPYA